MGVPALKLALDSPKRAFGAWFSVHRLAAELPDENHSPPPHLILSSSSQSELLLAFLSYSHLCGELHVINYQSFVWHVEE